jgi:hypothetical protein
MEKEMNTAWKTLLSMDQPIAGVSRLDGNARKTQRDCVHSTQRINHV